MGDIGRRAASGGAIAVSAQIVKLLVQFGTLAVMARLLLPADFGLVAMATTVTLFVGLFTDFGLSAATVQRAEIDHGTVSALFYINVATGAALMLLAIAAAPLAAWGFGDPRVSPVVMALAAQIPFVAATAQHNALLRRGMRWVTLHAAGIAAQISGAAVAIALAWQTGLGYWALVAQSWTVALVDLVLVWSLCPWRPGRIDDWQQARSAVGFGMHLTGFNFLNYINRQFDDVLIGWRWGAAELGYYTRAYQLLLLPLSLVNNPVGSAVIPALSRLQSKPEEWRRLYLDALTGSAFFSIGITAFLCSSAQLVVAILYGPNWTETGQIFFYLSIGMFPAAIVNTVGWIYVSTGRTQRMFAWGAIKAVAVIIGFSIGLPYGAKGIAISYSTVECLGTLPALAMAAAGTPVSVSQICRRTYLIMGAGIATTLITIYFLKLANLSGVFENVILSISAFSIVYIILCTFILFLDREIGPLKREIFSAYRRRFSVSLQ